MNLLPKFTNRVVALLSTICARNSNPETLYLRYLSSRTSKICFKRIINRNFFYFWIFPRLLSETIIAMNLGNNIFLYLCDKISNLEFICFLVSNWILSSVKLQFNPICITNLNNENLNLAVKFPTCVVALLSTICARNSNPKTLYLSYLSNRASKISFKWIINHKFVYFWIFSRILS